MVISNMTKFHKILIKSIRFREQMSSGQTYVSTYDGRIGVTLHAPAMIHYHGGNIMAGSIKEI